jgi:hypothetical protein
MSSTARKFRSTSKLVLTTPIADDAPRSVKEAALRRRLVALTGKCPCGAELAIPEVVPGSVTVVAVEHEEGCPAAEVLP